MSYIETSQIKNSTIMFLYSEKDEIQLDPHYQRMGGVWTKEKKQLLIDSILNDYDLPKIYFHSFDQEKKSKTGFSFSVIDGRQRLETIWQFIDGEFTLSEDFEFQRDPTIKLAKLGYQDIAKEYPRIRIKFDSFVLPVIAVETDDEELIEDMFTRLNEAVPLNAAEKRNSIPGDMSKAIRTVSNHNFFNQCVLFSNKRYQFREVAARLLLTEESLETNDKIIDTKKIYLDALTNNYQAGKEAFVESLIIKVSTILDAMCDVFVQSDELLRSQGNMTLYYLLFRFAKINNELEKLTRKKLFEFYDKLKENRQWASLGMDHSFELLEFDRLTQQGTNDSSNIKERYRILADTLLLSQGKI